MKTLLSEEVQVFYKFPGYELSNKNEESPVEYLDDDGLLIWTTINDSMKFADSTNLDDLIQNYEECCSRVNQFYQILQELWSHEIYDDQLICKYSSWTDRSEEILELIHCDINVSVLVLEKILLFSSILEFSLGNVFYSIKNCYPPHLLKELLKSAEISKILPQAVPFLRYTLGTPVSVNLRNIAWHGFMPPTDDDSHELYSKLLLAIILSLGRDLAKLNFKISSRPYALESIEKFDTIVEKLESFDVNSISSSENLFVRHSLSHYHAGRYGRCLLLLFPILESQIREKFGIANDFDTRARIDGYYFTMDMIFDQDVGVGCDAFEATKRNKVRELLDDTALSMLYDFLVCPKGPRIRDHFSHGELLLKHVDENVARSIIIFYKTLITGPNENLIYESYFHPISELYRQLGVLKSTTKALLSIEISVESEKKFVNLLEWPDIQEAKLTAIRFLRDSELNKLNFLLNLMVQTINNSISAVSNYHKALEQRNTEYKERKLSQARRKTFIKMVEVRETVLKGFEACVQIVKIMLKNLQSKFITSNMSKDLRLVLKTVENMKKYLTIDCNDWKSSVDGSLCITEIFNKYQNNLH